MSRPAAIVRYAAIGLGVAFIVVLLAVVIILRTSGFQSWAKDKIVAAIAEGTGGATEIGSFSFDPGSMHARIVNLVIHGSEPAGAAPFVRVAQVDLTARLFGGGRVVGISSLSVQQPQVNVIVFPDGRTNLPTPKPSPPSKTTPLETVVDLAVGHFELNNGRLTFNNRQQPLDVAANNLHAQLFYRLLQADYTGRITLQPIYVVAGRNTPVTYSIDLPLTLDRDRIGLAGATIATSASTLHIDGALQNLRQPVFSGRVQGQLALADLDHTLGLDLDTSRGLPQQLQLDVNATASSDQVKVASLAVDLGQSHFHASGLLKDSRAGSTLQFDGSLALAELARMARLSARPEGSLLLNGNAALDAANRYRVSGRLASRGLALRQGSLRVPSAAIATDFNVDPASVDLTALRLDAFGGEFAGNATLQDLARYQVKGNLRHFDIATLAQLAGQKLPYSGIISGPVQADGDLKAPNGLEAQGDLAIAPGANGIPLRGRLHGGYRAASGNVYLADSYLALPHSRLTLAGSTAQGVNINLVTSDLHDFLAAVPSAAPPPVTLAAGGQVGFTGSLSGSLAVPRVAGHLSATQFQVEGRQFASLAADVAASPSAASVANGSLTRGPMSAQFSASAGLHDWSPEPRDNIAANVDLRNGDIADLLVLAGQSAQGFSGALTAAVHVAGTMGNPAGAINLHAANGTLHDEPYDQVDAQISLTDQRAVIQQASLVAGASRIDLTGSFQHPRDSFTQGDVQASLQTSQVDLARLRSLPNTSGQLQLNVKIAGRLGPAAPGPAPAAAVPLSSSPSSSTEFLVSSVQADGSVRALHYQGQAYGDVVAAVRSSGQTANADLTSNFAGSNVRLHAVTRLVSGYPTDADAQISGLPVERVLAVAGRGDLPVRGKLSATAHVRDLPAQPVGDLSLDLAGAAAYGQNIDHLQVRATSAAQSVELTRFDVASGPSHLSLTGRFDHPAGKFDSGNMQFRVENGHLDLARLSPVQNARPGLAGAVEISADGAAALAPGASVRVTSANANIAGQRIAVGSQNLGGFTLAAHTTSGDRLDFNLNSDVAGAALQASGNGQLSGDYPVNAQLSFNNVKWTNLQKLIGTPSNEPPAFEISAQGKASVNGPILQTDALQAALEIDGLKLETLPLPHAGHAITIENQGPVQARLDRGVVSLTGFHLAGPQTDIQASGRAVLAGGSLNLTATAGVDLAVLQNLSHDITSSGKIALNAAVRGTMSNPQANGSLQLQNATFNYADLPNGLSNANGTVSFQGNRASIQNLTAESGGGKITISGFASYAGAVRFAVRANASKVRVLIQQGVSIVGNADINIGGVLANSTATGSVTLTQLNYAPQSDLGSMLTRAAPDVTAPQVPNPLLDNMKLDIRVRTSPAMQIQSSLAESLQTDADLRLAGSPARPIVLGRINLTDGRLVFFGTTYDVNSGSISFINPVRIQPILNLSLETQTKGVNVVLNVTGPLDNMQLTYTSDPPLQFQEIVTLLSTGKVPTSDPTLLANQPAQPSQTFEQSGESAILGQAVANPVASRLQRVFGVSQLSIDPAFTGSSALPTAQVTLQQRISSAITFTYSEALDDPNSTLIRAEWALNPRWSATALRDQNGIVSVKLLYKRQFR